MTRFSGGRLGSGVCFAETVDRAPIASRESDAPGTEPDLCTFRRLEPRKFKA